MKLETNNEILFPSSKHFKVNGLDHTEKRYFRSVRDRYMKHRTQYEYLTSVMENGDGNDWTECKAFEEFNEMSKLELLMKKLKMGIF